MKIRSLIMAFAMLLCALLWSWQPSLAHAATLMVTNTSDGGPGSLRQAILDADAASSGSLIQFNIPTSNAGFNAAKGTFTIHPASALPALTANGITLDGSTQAAFSGNTNAAGPEVVLNGSGRLMEGLVINSAGCAVRDLVINGFAGSSATDTGGVKMSGAAASGNRVEGCFIGTDATGNTAVPNFNGILIITGAHNNHVGGPTVSMRNVIAGNNNDGVSIGFSGANGNVVQGNYIGVKASGQAALPNQESGVALFSGASRNVIGGTVLGARNIISGNLSDGVFIGFAGANNNVVQGNYLGINAVGNAALPNQQSGVAINGGAQNNLIGGSTVSARNVISANIGDGVFIGSVGTVNNAVQGNYLGTNASGTVALLGGKYANGVALEDGASVT